MTTAVTQSHEEIKPADTISYIKTVKDYYQRLSQKLRQRSFSDGIT